MCRSSNGATGTQSPKIDLRTAISANITRCADSVLGSQSASRSDRTTGTGCRNRVQSAGAKTGTLLGSKGRPPRGLREHSASESLTPSRGATSTPSSDCPAVLAQPAAPNGVHTTDAGPASVDSPEDGARAANWSRARSPAPGPTGTAQHELSEQQHITNHPAALGVPCEPQQRDP